MQYSADLRAYESTIRALPRLTDEEEAVLVERVRLAHEGVIPAQLGIQAKRRLVEGSLGLVVFLVRHHLGHLKSLEVLDLVQEGNLALVQVVEHCHTFQGGKFSAYVGAAIKTALCNARTLDAAIHIPPGSVYSLCKRGKIAAIDAMQPCSLDAPFVSHQSQASNKPCTWEDMLAAPASDPSSTANQLTAKVEGILASLTARQQQVLRVRYGLDPCDGRTRTREEAGRELGVTKTTMQNTERRALRNIRHHAQGSSVL